MRLKNQYSVFNLSSILVLYQVILVLSLLCKNYLNFELWD